MISIPQNCADSDRRPQTGSEPFESIYMASEKKLFVYAYSILKSRQEAEDVIQDVFLKILSNPGILSEVRCAGAYLFTMCRNACLAVLAKRKRGESGLPAEPFALLLADSADEDASKNEEAEMLNRAIGALTPGQREIVVLKVYESKTLEEISRMTNIPAGTVATRYRSAMMKIKNALCAKAR
jgi:RNA polymerase sigma-70 factor, ECF subfamily